MLQLVLLDIMEMLKLQFANSKYNFYNFPDALLNVKIVLDKVNIISDYVQIHFTEFQL